MATFSNSKLINYTKRSPNHSGLRTHAIDTITIHCMAGNLTVETCGAVFASRSRQASSNYGIGSDGRIGLYVDEKNRSWCSSSPANDQRAITIEVANDGGAPDWHVSDKAMKSLIKLCADICRRNGIKKLLWKNDKSLIGQVDKQNMTVHRWFAAKACPGDYLMSKHSYIAEEVNKLLGANEEKKATDPLAKYTDEQLARMVIRGDFGNGQARKKALGERYDAVQKIVTRIMKGESAVYYYVRNGDTLSKIARMYGTTVKALETLNKFKNPNVIYKGQRIRIR